MVCPPEPCRRWKAHELLCPLYHRPPRPLVAGPPGITSIRLIRLCASPCDAHRNKTRCILKSTSFHKFKHRCLLRRVAIRALVHLWECATWCVWKLHSAYQVRYRRGGPNTAGPTWSARAKCRSGRTNTCLRHFSEHCHKNVHQRW